ILGTPVRHLVYSVRDGIRERVGADYLRPSPRGEWRLGRPSGSVGGDVSAVTGGQPADRRCRGDVRTGHGDVTRETDQPEITDDEIGCVQLPPAVAVFRRPRIGMVVVVPALAIADDADEKVVLASLVSCVIAIAPPVRHRIDRPCLMPDHDGAYKHAPDQQTGTELNRLLGGAPQQQLGHEPSEKEQEPGPENDPALPVMAFEPDIETIA